jgi:hypothetical protein
MSLANIGDCPRFVDTDFFSQDILQHVFKILKYERVVNPPHPEKKENNNEIVFSIFKRLCDLYVTTNPTD